MRKAIGLALLLIIISGLILLAGCGRKPVLDYEELMEGKKKGEIKLKTEEGETTVSKGIDEEELCAPIYPGAQLDEDTTQTTEATGDEGQIGIASATFRTTDAVADVIAWYRNELSGESEFKEMASPTAGRETGVLSYKSGDRSVNITISKDREDQSKTVISIISGTSQPGQAP